MTEQATFDPSGVRTLYASSPQSRPILDHFASRQQDRSEITVDRMWEVLTSEGNLVTRADVIEVFRSLERLGAGTFVLGRKGHPSRFQRSVSLIEVGRAARGNGLPAVHTKEPAPPQPAVVKSDVITHRYVLRPDFTVTLQLPTDLSPAEALRLSEYLRTLPFSA